MKKKDILQNAIVLPIIIGVVLSILLFFYLNSNIDAFLPLPKDTAFAYHNDLSNNNEVKEDVDSLLPNDCIGEISLSNIQLKLYYCADYAKLVSGLSMQEDSTPLNEIGCAYLKSTNRVANELALNDTIKISSIYGDFEYSLVEEVTVANEYKALAIAPDEPRSLVVYYQASNGNGLSSEYKALVYKEVR